jgi:ABC-type transport system involved in multi-copper enzyme maturation permease subunit
MNASTFQALLRDALAQVLGNWVFRILALLVAVPVLATFLLGFHEQEMVFLFGLQRWDYAGFLEVFGYSGLTSGVREVFLEIVYELVFSFYAGVTGVLFCIVATSFFVPRMLERGAADLLFHKPLSRLALYLSRYVAGLLFIGLLALLLVSGMYLGLLLVSEYNDPAIFWAAPTLVYVFALILPVCMLVGAITRSTVASILLSTLFFFGNGCVHMVWQGIEQGRETASAKQAEERGPGPVARGFVIFVDGAHYALPKTSDADEIAAKLRGADAQGPSADDWYARKLGNAPGWKFSIFFSIGSSLLFAAVMLLLGWWRVARLDF